MIYLWGFSVWVLTSSAAVMNLGLFFGCICTHTSLGYVLSNRWAREYMHAFRFSRLPNSSPKWFYQFTSLTLYERSSYSASYLYLSFYSFKCELFWWLMGMNFKTHSCTSTYIARGYMCIYIYIYSKNIKTWMGRRDTNLRTQITQGREESLRVGHTLEGFNSTYNINI